MRLEIEGERVIITLSRRNLLSGLQKLDMENSARTIESIYPELDKTLVFSVEDDDEHYHHPARHESIRGLAGVMHPSTEGFVRDSVS